MERQSLQLEIYLLPVLCLLFRLTSVMSFHCWGWMTYWRMEFLVMDHPVRMQRHCVRCFWTLPQGGWVFVSRRIFMNYVSLKIWRSPCFWFLRVLHDVWLFEHLGGNKTQITSLSAHLHQCRKEAGICECCKYVLSCSLFFENPLLCTLNPLVVSTTLISSFGHLVVTTYFCCVIY